MTVFEIWTRSSKATHFRIPKIAAPQFLESCPHPCDPAWLPATLAFQPYGKGQVEGEALLLLLIPRVRNCLHHFGILPLNSTWSYDVIQHQGKWIWVLVLLLHSQNCYVTKEENECWGNLAVSSLLIVSDSVLTSRFFRNSSEIMNDGAENRIGVSCRAPGTRDWYWTCSSCCELRKTL